MLTSIFHGTRWSLLFLSVVSFHLSEGALADTAPTAPEVSGGEKKPSKITSLFGNSFNANGFFQNSEEEEKAAPSVAPTPLPATAAAPTPTPTSTSEGAAPVAPIAPDLVQKREQDKPVFVSSDPSSHITPPDQNAKVRINPEAPGPFIAMADAFQRGDEASAKGYARQFVRYMVDLMFQVKALTNLIGEAMIEEGTIKEEDWVGVDQYLDAELAQAREATNSPIKPTHEEALKRIKADPNGEAEIYFFFSLGSSHARKMAPDVERLWQITKKDSKLKMVALLLSEESKEYVEAYRRYTGLTAPVMEGRELAKSFRVAFVPTLVVVSPNTKAAYKKTGQQDFRRMYEFVRTVQGQGIEFTPEATRLAALKIGTAEKNPLAKDDSGVKRAKLSDDVKPGAKAATKSKGTLPGVLKVDPREAKEQKPGKPELKTF